MAKKKAKRKPTKSVKKKSKLPKKKPRATKKPRVKKPPAAPSKLGTIVWRDLTVPNAALVRDFYANVVGWTASPVSMGDYDDFSMVAPASGETVAGICHARGMNSGQPPQWLMYIQVPDVDAAANRASACGGRILVGPKELGTFRFCVIQDPAGAVAGLITPG